MRKKPVHSADLKEEKPNPDSNNAVIVGASVRAGRIDAKMRRYLAKHAKVLQTKPLYLFLCCASETDFDKYLQKNIPESLLSTARCAMHFGGEYNVEAAKGLEKKLLAAMLQSSKEKALEPLCIKSEAIENLCETFLRDCKSD
jgi:menaquinone-dependent protoporphyrinogen IX oxidase